MINPAFETIIDQRGVIQDGANVLFDRVTLTTQNISYDEGAGVITFKQPGQYSIKWWIATETVLRGAHLLQLKFLSLAPAYSSSPMKTGQISGFTYANIEQAGETMSLVNGCAYPIVLSRSADYKGYLLITPAAAPVTRVYRANLSTPGSAINVPLGDGIIYKLSNVNSSQCKLELLPLGVPTYYDYKRYSVYDSTAPEGDNTDNQLISGSVTKDGLIFGNSREIHWVVIRVQNPNTLKWSTYEVRLFISNGFKRATVWVNVIEEEETYN